MRFEYPELLSGLDVSRETTDRLKAFLDLVEKWNPKINLVAQSTLADGWTRHVVDSAQIWLHAGKTQGSWLDLGSGGGFPGLVIAILARELAPRVRVILVESDQRKCVFLRECCRQLDVSADVFCDRIENLAPFGASVISARALAGLDSLLRHCDMHLALDGLALFAKGRGFADEIEDARRNWDFEVESCASHTDPSGRILKVWGLKHV